jgi:hypothetical protein
MKTFYVLSYLILFGCASSGSRIDIPSNLGYDCNNQTVKLLSTEDVYIATAGYTNDEPVLKYNPIYFRQVSKEFQWFLFFHEMGHYSRCETFTKKTDEEKMAMQIAADLYSVRVLVKERGFTRDQMLLVYYEVNIRFTHKERAEIIKKEIEKLFETVK